MFCSFVPNSHTTMSFQFFCFFLQNCAHMHTLHTNRVYSMHCKQFIVMNTLLCLHFFCSQFTRLNCMYSPQEKQPFFCKKLHAANALIWDDTSCIEAHLTWTLFLWSTKIIYNHWARNSVRSFDSFKMAIKMLYGIKSKSVLNDKPFFFKIFTFICIFSIGAHFV